MKTKIFKSVLMAIIVSTLFSFDMPDGWHKAGVNSESYEMEITKGQGIEGKNAATIKSTVAINESFGTLMQMCSPDKYLGKQIKMTGYLRTENEAE